MLVLLGPSQWDTRGCVETEALTSRLINHVLFLHLLLCFLFCGAQRKPQFTMANTHQDASLEEKIDETTKEPLAPGDVSPTRLENGMTKTGLLMNESEALDWAREHPDDVVPIYVTFSPHDPDNPREWPRWKKWYLTCFVCQSSSGVKALGETCADRSTHCFRPLS